VNNEKNEKNQKLINIIYENWKTKNKQKNEKLNMSEINESNNNR